jgi:hypothetical protein
MSPLTDYLGGLVTGLAIALVAGAIALLPVLWEYVKARKKQLAFEEWREAAGGEE